MGIADRIILTSYTIYRYFFSSAEALEEEDSS